MTMRSRPAGLTSICAALIVAAASGAHAQVTNGGFETADLGGWTVSGETSFIGVAEGIGHSGDYAAFFGPDPAGSISQTLVTEPGQAYRVSFWLALDDSATPSQFSWSWDGSVRAQIIDAAGFDYVSAFSATVTATGASSVLQFNFANPASFWRLDDVSVSVVPEPVSAALMALGLLGLAGARARSLRRTP